MLSWGLFEGILGLPGPSWGLLEDVMGTHGASWNRLGEGIRLGLPGAGFKPIFGMRWMQFLIIFPSLCHLILK